MKKYEKSGEYSYRLTVSNGFDITGKRIRLYKTVTLDPKLTDNQITKELNRLQSEFETSVKTGQYIDKHKITFYDFTKVWLRDHAQKQLEPKTIARYIEMLSRINQVIGHIKLEKLQPMHFNQLYSNLEEAGIRLDSKYKFIQGSISFDIKTLAKGSGVSARTIQDSVLKSLNVSQNTASKISNALNVKLEKIFTRVGDPARLHPRTILHHHRLITSILQVAVQWQYLLNNPASRIKPPKTEKPKIKYYDEDQTKELLLALEKEPINYKVMTLIDIFAGLRVGELFGLEWSNINFKKGTIEINKASQYLSGKGTFTKEPKNDTSIRTISLPPPIVELLKSFKIWWFEQKLIVGDLWQGSDRLFVTWNGKPMYTYTLTNWFPSFLKRHNLPKITPHGLRHTHATLLNSMGLDTNAISKRMGHARTSTTQDIYMHAFKSSDRAASDLLENKFLEKSEENKKHG